MVCRSPELVIVLVQLVLLFLEVWTKSFFFYINLFILIGGQNLF